MSVEVRDQYVDALDNLTSALKNSYEDLKTSCLSDSNFDYSQAITNRLRAFYTSQCGTKNFLNKRVAQAGSDFFVETILFFLKLYNDINNLGFEIKSEQALKRRRNSLRPDISIWNSSTPEAELLAVIECKTQLGWLHHGQGLNSYFEDRQNKVAEVFPKAKVFLVVMSGCNWTGFGDDQRVGKELFCLLNSDVWPTELPIDYDESCLENRIELLFEQLRNLRSEKSGVAN